MVQRCNQSSSEFSYPKWPVHTVGESGGPPAWALSEVPNPLNASAFRAGPMTQGDFLLDGNPAFQLEPGFDKDSGSQYSLPLYRNSNQGNMEYFNEGPKQAGLSFLPDPAINYENLNSIREDPGVVGRTTLVMSPQHGFTSGSIPGSYSNDRRPPVPPHSFPKVNMAPSKGDLWVIRYIKNKPAFKNSVPVELKDEVCIEVIR